MAITFVVEDGTGLTNATSYVSVAEFEAYWLQKGIDFSSSITYPTATKQAWLNEATQYADLTYSWGGTRMTEDQALEVPRYFWFDTNYTDISESVPTYLKNGICELAKLRQATATNETASGNVASETFGPVSVSYRGNSSADVKYPQVEKWFYRILAPAGFMAWPT